MTVELPERLTVAACIGCGARSRAGECDGGCDDVPLDIVDAGPVDALAEHLAALERRVRALRSLARTGDVSLDTLRDAARDALRIAVPPREPDAPVYEAWGCPRCGRIDAPQPCIGVCIRRPVLTADAAEYRRLARAADELAGEERELVRPARMLANVRARPGHEQATADALRRQLASITRARA
jgi:hypothetical protein